MKWFDKDENMLVQRAFLLGVTGIILCLIPVFNSYYQLLKAPMGPLNGIGIGLQLFATSILVLVLRKRKVDEKAKEKAQKMMVVLGAALVYFMIVV